jgi:hypothetical protein
MSHKPFRTSITRADPVSWEKKEKKDSPDCFPSFAGDGNTPSVIANAAKQSGQLLHPDGNS